MPTLMRIRSSTRFVAMSVDRELSDDERGHLEGVLEAAVGLLDHRATLEPRAVHLKHPVIEEPDLAEDGTPTGGVTRRLSAAAAECPDCRRSTQAGNGHVGFDYLCCPLVPGTLPTGVRPCHEGCLIACGRKG